MTDTIHTEENQYRKFVRYEIMANDMPTAWAFIMAHVDEFKTPGVEITGEHGSWDMDEDENYCDPYVKYRVAVFGDIEGGW